MKVSNVQSKVGVTLVGGGNPTPEEIVKAMAIAPFLMAADGGANFCVAAGEEPLVVMGDLDSVSDATRARLADAEFISIAEQETTDFEKCLTRIDAPFVLATGFTQGRLDHTLEAFSVLARNPGPPTIVTSDTDIAFAVPEFLALDLPEGCRVSLFPMTKVRGRSEGLQWPIDDMTLDPLQRTGVSNVSLGKVRLTMDNQGCLILLPRELLDEAIAALIG